MEFLAQIAPVLTPVVTQPIPSEATFVYLLIGAISFFVLNGAALVAIWAGTGRQFATKAELHQLRQEVAALNQRNEQISSEIFRKLDTLTSSVNHSLQEMCGAIGKLEGRQALAHEIVEAIRK